MPHTLYEQTTWEWTERDSALILASATEYGHIRLMFDGGQNLRTGYGYGSFKIGRNDPIRIQHREFKGITSVQSEMMTLLGALRYLRANINPSQHDIVITGDAKGIIEMVNRKVHAYHFSIKDLYDLIMRYVDEYQSARAHWIPRELIVRHFGH